MKFDIKLNGNKYLVEIDNFSAKILKKTNESFETLDIDNKEYAYVPDFDFTEEENSTSIIKATLPGTVIEIDVSVGTKVKKGEKLMVLESMKMENVLTAPHDCLIEEILVSIGSYVTKEQDLVAIMSN
ncbi:MAG: acetyl-CoA carboxylase biotin carboxyl carrier protein subunit [Christensenellaceae bacterium]|nr:acetyl-CoA carboxylase biotin carboxyl carrier protein subunit [Christensenellaceae bacterium]